MTPFFYGPPDESEVAFFSVSIATRDYSEATMHFNVAGAEVKLEQAGT